MRNEIARVFAAACVSSHPGDVVNSYLYMSDRFARQNLKKEEIVDGLARWAIDAILHICAFQSEDEAKEHFLSIFNDSEQATLMSVLGKYPASDAHTAANDSVIQYGPAPTFLASITILGRDMMHILRNSREDKNDSAGKEQ